MPELPDISAYIGALETRIVGQRLEHIRLTSAFLLRTAQPPISDAVGRVVRELRRIGKRIAIGLDNDIWLVLHLMIAGRLHWRAAGVKLGGRNNLAAFDFPNGSLVLTEAGTKRRASLHVLNGSEGLNSIDPGGIDVFASNLSAFRAALTIENRTLKRALTDRRIVSGVGNAYSDEILHAARLSPVMLTRKLLPVEWERLFAATRHTLQLWIDRLREQASAGFPEKVTAFRKDGRPWAFRRTMSRVRRKGAAYTVCRQRNKLLRSLPDGGESPCGSRAVPPFRVGLAAHTGRIGISQAAIGCDRWV